MFQSIKQGFGLAVGVIVGIAVVGSLIGNYKVEITKIKPEVTTN